MLREGRNVVSQQVPLQAPGGVSAGSLTVSVVAVEALQAVMGTAGAVPPSVPPSPPPPPSLDEQLNFRVEALNLAAAYQREPRQQRFYVSVDFLGKEFSSQELAKAAAAAPLQINKLFAFPVDSAHPTARDQLLRAMQPGAPGAQSEIKFRLYHVITATEADELAVGSLNLRKLWDDPRRQELQAHRLQLIDEQTRDVSSLVVSTNVIPALRRLLQTPARR